MADVNEVLVVQNGEKGGPRRFGDWLTGIGLGLEVVHAYQGAALPASLEHDALIVLGGGYLPDDDDRAPWLASVRALVAEALDRSVPVFGICLGGQLIAQVAGGRVEAEAGLPEHGSTPIRIRPEAGNDPLFHALPDVVPAIEHHVDAITSLPAGAVWLADSATCPHQAFRMGACAWGVQFHPEIAPDRIPEWNEVRLREQGLDPDELYRRAVADEPVSTPVWRTVATRFAEVVRDVRPARR